MRIVGLSGSLRKASTNTGLLRCAAEIAKSAGVDFEIVEIGHLPFMNEDLEVDGKVPDVVDQFKQSVASADALMFACPEYNYGVTPALKNALDWASRQGSVWAKKPAAIMGSGGGFGTGRGQLALRQSFIFLDIIPLSKPEVCVRRFTSPSPFDANGDVVDEMTKNSVQASFDALMELTKTLQAGKSN